MPQCQLGLRDQAGDQISRRDDVVDQLRRLPGERQEVVTASASDGL